MRRMNDESRERQNGGGHGIEVQNNTMQLRLFEVYSTQNHPLTVVVKKRRHRRTVNRVQIRDRCGDVSFGVVLRER